MRNGHVAGTSGECLYSRFQYRSTLLLDSPLLMLSDADVTLQKLMIGSWIACYKRHLLSRHLDSKPAGVSCSLSEELAPVNSCITTSLPGVTTGVNLQRYARYFNTTCKSMQQQRSLSLRLRCLARVRLMSHTCLEPVKLYIQLKQPTQDMSAPAILKCSLCISSHKEMRQR